MSKCALYRKMMQHGIKLSTKHPSETNNNFKNSYLKSVNVSVKSITFYNIPIKIDLFCNQNSIGLKYFVEIWFSMFTGGKPRNYHEIVLTQICSQATSGTRRGSFQAENWIKKGWCHVHFCFILQLRTNNGEIRQCSSV